MEWSTARAITGPARRALAASALALGTLLAAGCGLSGSLGGSGTAITLYNGQHPQTTDAIVAGFEKATGITVAVRSGEEDDLADQIVTEGAGSPADVVYTENSPALEFLQSRGLLAPVDRTTLARVPARYDSPVGDWVGVSARVSVLVYDPALISPAQLPRTALALAAPRYRGKLAFAAGETDFQPIVTAVDRAYGRRRTLAWLAGLKANAGPHVLASNEAVTDMVNNGAVAFGVIDQYYWYRLRSQLGAGGMHSRLAFFAPEDPGYVVDVSGAAVLESTDRSPRLAAEAQRFLSYLVSPAAQQIIASPARSASYEYPIGSGVTTRAPETPLGRLRPYPITVAELGDGSTAIALLRQAGLL
jgi:iron(III) transport system substrate-binding protein